MMQVKETPPEKEVNREPREMRRNHYPEVLAQPSLQPVRPTVLPKRPGNKAMEVDEPLLTTDEQSTWSTTPITTKEKNAFWSPIYPPNYIYFGSQKVMNKGFESFESKQPLGISKPTPTTTPIKVSKPIVQNEYINLNAGVY